MYEVQQQIHMRNLEHHHSPNSPSRLLNIHSQSHPLQSIPPMHQKNHHLHQQSQVSFYPYARWCGKCEISDWMQITSHRTDILLFHKYSLPFCHYLFIIANTATVSKPICATATATNSSANANERTLCASHTPTIEWRTSQRHWIESSINYWMHVKKCLRRVQNTPNCSNVLKTHNTVANTHTQTQLRGFFLRADLWLLLFKNEWKKNLWTNKQIN